MSKGATILVVFGDPLQVTMHGGGSGTVGFSGVVVVGDSVVCSDTDSVTMRLSRAVLGVYVGACWCSATWRLDGRKP